MSERVSTLRIATVNWLLKFGLLLNKNAMVLEISCGLAALFDIHPGWHGAEYSEAAVERIRQANKGVRVSEEDAQKL